MSCGSCQVFRRTDVAVGWFESGNHGRDPCPVERAECDPSANGLNRRPAGFPPRALQVLRNEGREDRLDDA